LAHSRISFAFFPVTDFKDLFTSSPPFSRVSLTIFFAFPPDSVRALYASGETDFKISSPLLKIFFAPGPASFKTLFPAFPAHSKALPDSRRAAVIYN